MDGEEEKALASRLFNDCWDLIEKTDRTNLENAEMLHLAHSSRWHWGNVGGAKEKAIGEWQCSRVNALLGNGSAALFHAELSRFWSADFPKSNFIHASAMEALAYAHHVLGDHKAASLCKVQALALLDGVNEKDAEHIRKQIGELPF